MLDREKVIKGLEMCIADDFCFGCPYEDKCFGGGEAFAESLTRDALELLKEQEKLIDDLTELNGKLLKLVKSYEDYLTPYGKVKDVMAAYDALVKSKEDDGK